MRPTAGWLGAIVALLAGSALLAACENPDSAFIGSPMRLSIQAIGPEIP